MIRQLPAAGHHPYRTALLACSASIAFHLASWLIWQASPKPTPEIKPPQVIEVALTAAPANMPPAAAAVPPKETPVERPKQEKPAPKKPDNIKPQAKPKPAIKPVAKPKIGKKPTPQPVKTEPVSVVAATNSAPAPISAAPSNIVPKPAPAAIPAPKPLVKAVYSSPSLKNPPTHYPRIAQSRQWEGTVILEIRVLANGSAGEVKIAHSSGHEILDDSAVEQVKSWRFIPAHKGNQTVDDWVRVPITFKFKH